MCSVQYLREFIKERLTAVCEEILLEVQKTVVHYEEEIDRQRRLLDISRTPDANSHITELPQQHDCEEEEGPDEQQVYNQERSSSLDQEDPEPPQIKEEQEEVCSSQEGERLVLKQEAEGVWTDEERLTLLETAWKPEIKLHRIDPQQQHVCEGEEILTGQQVCNQERNSIMDQEDPEPPQIKEEQEELCSGQEQLGLKQEADAFMVTPTYEERDETDAEPNSEEQLSHSSSEAESQDQEKSQHVDSRSTRIAEVNKRNRRHHRKRSHSQSVDNTPMSEIQSQTDTGKNSIQCGTCGKTFQYKSHLVRHLRIHTGEKPYSCSTCGKKFNEESTLKSHVRVHTDEKPYLCGNCGKRFRWRTQLVKHMRIHTS
ncbi:zinc finger and SCAN domain-containing protein 30-like [Archocentrus centrarchus]|uniref:zinc finger and SCAN domain-containing protein 30-like n=1 Tax=Archocentrus centrarchus TaxID=63155 RepID=UPI0011EA0446|nr:zinc finger and SCAN domain-containing protein 30-like [Archocentrus centrarchus]